MPRYTLDLAALRDAANPPNPITRGVGSALADILNAQVSAARIRSQRADREQQRAFEIHRLFETEAYHRQQAQWHEEEVQRQTDRDAKDEAFHAQSLAEMHGHNVAEEGARKRQLDLDESRAAETKRHDQTEEGLKAGEQLRGTLEDLFGVKKGGKAAGAGAHEKEFDPDVTEKGTDPNTGMPYERSRAKSAQEVQREVATRKAFESGMGEGGGTGNGIFDALGHLFGGGGAPAGAGAAPAPASPAGPSSMAPPAVPKQSDEDLAGYQAVLAKIPDLDKQMQPFLDRARGDEPQRMRAAIASGDHETVQQLLDGAASQAPSADGTPDATTVPAAPGPGAQNFQAVAPGAGDDFNKDLFIQRSKPAYDS